MEENYEENMKLYEDLTLIAKEIKILINYN